MKRSTHNHFDSVEKQSYKRKYLERLLEQEDAERQIRSYRSTQMSETSAMDEERPMRHVPFRES